MKKTLFVCILVILAGFSLWRAQNTPQDAGLPTPPPRPQPSASDKNLPALPDQAGSLTLATFYSGEAAIRDILKLHNSSFPLDEGLIARYESESGEATVWVSVSPDAEEASELMRLMVEKMPASQVFTEESTFEAGGKTVYYVTGMGMDHYYWQEGIYIYWVAVDGAEPLEVLAAFLEK